MIRALLFLVQAGMIVALALWLVTQTGGGQLTLTWRGEVITTTLDIAVLAVIAFSLVVAVIAAFVRAVFSLPARWQRFRGEVAREDAYRALTKGLVAVAAGDAVRAQKMAERAEKVLPDQPLTRLLHAQAALLSGNRAAARRGFEALLDDPEGAFFGLRGLLADSVHQRDYQAARDHLLVANRLQSGRPWIVRGLFDMQARTRDWIGAERTLKQIARAKALDEGDIRQLRQVVWLAQAQHLAHDTTLTPAVRSAESLRFAKAAYQQQPDFIPAVLGYADALIVDGSVRRARKVLRKAWSHHPHPQLITRWQALLPAERIKGDRALNAAQEMQRWCAELAALRPDHTESQRLLGQPTPPALETWCCASCGHRDDLWQPLCPQCDAINSLAWRRPDLQQGHARPHDLLTTPGDLLAPPQVGYSGV